MSPGQAAHRHNLITYFSIPAGSRVLELGCGQGDTTEVLASFLGPYGHVDAIDPGSNDYGSPLTLSQAQALITAKPNLGEIITFKNETDPIDYLSTYTGPSYDFIILVHCVWYFENEKVLGELVRALGPHVQGETKLCIAEWSMRASTPAAFPHVLTAFLRSSLEAKRKVPSSGNIRTVLSPVQITAAVTSSSSPENPLKLLRSTTERTNEGMLDGYWEVSDILRRREKEVATLKDNGVSEGEVAVLESLWDGIESGVRELEGGVKGVRSMDFWEGVFGRSD